MFVWIAVLIALVPAFALFVYVARIKKSIWIAFAFGAVGWTVAGYTRFPIVSWIPSVVDSQILYFAFASLLAGVFEEGVRYGLMWKIRYLRIDWKHVLAFGLGWGFIEAVILYAANILAAIYILGYELSFSDMLAGAAERDFTVIFHVSLTFVIYKAVSSRKFVWVVIAVVLHTIVDFIAVTLFHILEFPVWHVEATVLAMSILTAILAYRLSQTNQERRVFV